jgi:Gas vesicle synthesis protein GvpL/GvpF
MAEAGRYLYAVTRGVAGSAVESIDGIGGAPVTLVEQGGLVAVVGTVDLDEFGEAALREHLEDLGWLERVAREHDRVVQAVAQLGPTAPLRLATICLDDDGVRDRLREWHDGLHAALDRVIGRAEWSAKVYVMAQQSQAGSDSPENSPASSGGGAAYLRRKQAQSRERRAAEQQGVDAARAIHEALGAASVASRLLAPQDPRLTGHEGTMTLNAAYLVPVDAQDAFLAESDRLAAADSQVRLEVNGPWPPYSFATLDDL